MGSREVIGRVAAQQGGIVTREQALRAGFSRHEIDNLVTFGRWRRLARAVYLVEPSAVSVRSWSASRPGTPGSDSK